MLKINLKLKLKKSCITILSFLTNQIKRNFKSSIWLRKSNNRSKSYRCVETIFENGIMTLIKTQLNMKKFSENSENKCRRKRWMIHDTRLQNLKRDSIILKRSLINLKTRYCPNLLIFMECIFLLQMKSEKQQFRSKLSSFLSSKSSL